MKKKLIVISSYPIKGTTHGEKTVGVASYTKNTLVEMKKIDPPLDITVMAETHEGETRYEEDGIHVSRSWRRGNIRDLYAVVKKIIALPYKKTVIVPIEIYMFGSLLHMAYVLGLLLLLKLKGIPVILVLHQVLEDMGNMERNKIKKGIFYMVKNMFYAYIIFLASKIVVFEEKFKKILPKSIKVVWIPHAIEQVHIQSKEVARTRLGLSPKAFITLYFGFLSPYKGVDKLLDVWKTTKENMLVIAGGANPNHALNKKYSKYVEKITKLAAKKQAIMTGFVPEDMIQYYFSAADVVILPYQLFFSSSGPLSLAFSYEKPVLLSEKIEDYFQSSDFRKGLKDISGLSQDAFIFKMNGEDISHKLAYIRNNISLSTQFARYIKKERSWKKVATKYAHLLAHI
ncbi:MAG: glycosyltransferase [bacterium]|nr:glycosyltransferase [bacterium]